VFKMIDSKSIRDTISNIYDGNSALDMLLEFESVLDSLHVYAYQNWSSGEVVQGPDISRYWIEVTLMYPERKMPDPDGALRLTKHGCYVFFQKEDYIVSVDIKSPDDLEARPDGEHKPKKVKQKVWLVKIAMPRHFVDEFKSEKININGTEIDMTDVSDAYEQGLDSAKEVKGEEDDNTI